MQVAVIGGTGLVGSRVVRMLRDHGDEVRVVSRKNGYDAYSGRGLHQGLAGAHVVVDVLNLDRPAYDYELGVDFFDTCTRNLLRAELAEGIQHHVGLTLIGAQRLDSSYFRGKVQQERLVTESPTPYTVLRTTVFYENVLKLIDHVGATRVVRLPPVRVRPVAVQDVAAKLCELAHAAPLMGSYELAGPEDWYLDELAREVLRATHDSRRVVPDLNALFLGARVHDDSLLPDWAEASLSFADWEERAMRSA